MGKLLKRLTAIIITVTLAFSAFPLQSISAQDHGQYTIEKIDGKEYGIESLKEGLEEKSFLDVYEGDPRDVINVIVELEDAPVIEKEIRGVSAFAMTQETNRLESQQATVIEEIQAVDSDANVNEQFTYLTNSIAVEIKAESFDSIKILSGVKRVFVEREYYLPEPQMTTSNGLVNAPNVWNTLNYKGEGMTVAVLDTGLDTDHPAFTVAPSSPKYTKVDVRNKLNEADKVHANVPDYDDLYHSEKVPFTFDYAMKKIEVKPDAATAAKISHGTHVAGTVAGNNGTDFKGVAPEAQVLIFKVFNDEAGGATDSVIMAALEDAVNLDVDAINMSLGSDAGFTSEADDYTNEMYARIKAAGILVSASAGNAHSAGIKNTWQLDLPLAEDPDHGIVGSPSTYNGPLSIASSENTHLYASVLKVANEDYTYVNTDNTIKAITGVHDFVSVPNFGEEADYENLNVTDKVVFVSRGEISFPEKMNYAEAAGAIGIIIYGTDNSLINMSVEGANLPAAYIIKDDYESIKNSGATTVDISDDEVHQVNPEANLPSSFSSMGTTSTLNIKPELTAPGGQIYSALPSQGNENYGMMSGTSMAAPHVAGGAALVKQYIDSEYPTLNASEKVALMDNLLMSTANIIQYKDANNIIRTAPVRQQGAGVMDLEKAITTKAYLSVDESQNDDGSSRPKLELKDSATGTYTLTFKVTNLSDEAQTYDLETIVTVPDALGVNYGEPIGIRYLMADENIDAEYTSTAPASVSVDAHASETISFDLTISDAVIAELSEAFVNGFYAEGYVKLVNQDQTGVDLNIPYLGFVGDWTKASIFDHANDNDVEYNGYLPSIYGHILASRFGQSLVNLGVSAFHEDPQDMEADYSNLVISPNNDGIFETLDTVMIGQLRNAKNLDLVVKDKDGNILHKQERENAFKSYYHGNLGQIVTYTHFTGQGFEPVSFADYEDGTYTLEFVANLGYKDSSDEVLSYDIKVDRVEPTVTKVAKEGNDLKINVTDETKLLYSEVKMIKITETGVQVVGSLGSEHTPYGENVEHTLNVSGADQIQLPYALAVSTVDAGYNEGVYLIMPEHIAEVSDEKWVLAVDDTRTIQAQAHPFVNPTFTSDDDSVASVTAAGEVTAHSVGTANISVSDATGNYNIEVRVVDSALVNDVTEYNISRNEQVTLSLTFMEEALDLSNPGLAYTYDAESLNVENGVITGLKAGSHILEIAYTVSDEDRLDTLADEAKEDLENDTVETADAEEAKTYTTQVVINVSEPDKTALQLIVDNYTPVDEAVYSEESVAALKEAYEHAQAVLADDNATQAEIDAAVAALNDAKNNLKYQVRGLEDAYDVNQGQSIVVNPRPVEGVWDYDPTLLTIERDQNGYRVTGLKAGSATATFTNADGESKTVTFNVKAKGEDPKDPIDPDVKPPIKDGDNNQNGNGSNGNGNGVNTGIESKESNSYIAILCVGLAIVGILIVTKKRVYKLDK